MPRTFLPFASLLLLSSSFAFAQAGPTASRLADIQVGGGFTFAKSDYVPNTIRGFAFYSDLDFSEHFGAELEFHQLNDPNPTKVYERTYEVGGRYTRHYSMANPYAKVLYGRGVFNFPQNSGNLAYNLMAFGGGVDLTVHPRVSVRGDFEYQHWFSGPALTDGLAPMLFTLGVAYHIPPGTPHSAR